MKYTSLVALLSVLLVLSACSSDSTTQTGATVSEDTPTYATTTDVELTQEDPSIVNLAGVMDTTYTYLDSLNKEYASGSLRDILALYPNTVVYFYPKDGTPNCTIQALDFSAMLADFQAKGYNIIGVSKDSLESHKAFADRNELKIALLQDPTGDLVRAFGAEGELQEYGNGDDLTDIIRSTYVVNSDGVAQYAIQDVEAKGHARAIYKLVTGEVYP